MILRFIKIITFIILVFLNYDCVSQDMIDTIITEDLDTISCQITYVSNYSIFYKYKNKKRIKEKIMPRLFVEDFVVNSPNITIKKQKFDSGINKYYKKSKLDRNYDILLLQDNTNESLKILADSTFVFKKNDFFKMAVNIELFVKQYRGKLVYIASIQNKPDFEIIVKLYDASDEYYHEILKSYKQKYICIFRGNNIMEYEKTKIRLKDTIIYLEKNEYYEFMLNDSTTTNNDKRKFKLLSLKFNSDIQYKEYYFSGNTDRYKLDYKDFIFIVASAVFSEGFVVFVPVNSGLIKTSNFVGEFMKLIINKYSEWSE